LILFLCTDFIKALSISQNDANVALLLPQACTMASNCTFLVSVTVVEFFCRILVGRL